MRPARLLRTATFRLAVAYAGLFIASAAVLFTIIYWTMTGYASSQLQTAIHAEVTTLIDEARREGPEHLLHAVEQRLQAADRRQSYYLLLDEKGRRPAGNLPISSPVPGWRELPVPEADEEEDTEDRRLLGFGTLTAGGEYLLVGRDTDLAELRELSAPSAGPARSPPFSHSAADLS